MIRPELKELKALTDGNHVIHSSEENEQFRKNLSDYVEAKSAKDKDFQPKYPDFRIEGSGSAEGGIAIDWWKILPLMNFGEQLSLRFHEEPIWGSDRKEWHMHFHLNVHNRQIGKSPFAKLSIEDMKKVTVACKELIKCAEDLLEYTRTQVK